MSTVVFAIHQRPRSPVAPCSWTSGRLPVLPLLENPLSGLNAFSSFVTVASTTSTSSYVALPDLTMSNQDLNKTLPVEASTSVVDVICSICAGEIKTLGPCTGLCKTVELPEALPHTPKCSTCGVIVLGDTWELFAPPTTTPLFGINGRMKTRPLVVQSLRCPSRYIKNHQKTVWTCRFILVIFVQPCRWF